MDERLEAQRLTRLSYKQGGIGFVEAYKLEGVFMVFVIFLFLNPQKWGKKHSAELL